jgi:hypothetical protein
MARWCYYAPVRQFGNAGSSPQTAEPTTDAEAVPAPLTGRKRAADACAVGAAINHLVPTIVPAYRPSGP